MSWDQIPHGTLLVWDWIEKWEHGQITHKTRNYWLRLLFKSGGDTNVSWGLWFGIINYKQL